MNPLKTLLVAAALAVVGAAPAHANEDATDYYLAPGSFITITDHETFGSNVTKKFKLDNYDIGRVWGKDNKTFKISHCVGGEVRLDIWINAWRYSMERSSVNAEMHLYEGVSCSSTDKDGSFIFTYTPLLTDAPALWINRQIDSTEGGDLAFVSLKLKAKPVADY